MIRYNENRDLILYIHYTINYYCIGHIERYTMTDKRTKDVFFTQWNFKKLEQLKYFKVLLELLKENRYHSVYCDLIKNTTLYKRLREESVTPIKTRTTPNKSEYLKDYQNLQGILDADHVRFSEEVVNVLEKYSTLIDLEKEYFPPEIITLSKMSYLVK